MKNEKLIKRREAAKLSRSQLASLVGCSHSMIAMMENGYRRPGLSIAHRVAGLLGVTTEYLWGGQ